ncbi:MAG TPA: serine hydrolase domain-containing protein [Pirellulales bacterium]|nr:serine hydrolase domain-containing protein [Pirellulales bacterium]
MPTHTTGCWAAFLLALAATGDAAQPKARDRNRPARANLSAVADRTVERFMQEKRVPGLVLAVLRDGNLVVERGYGVLSPEDERRPDSDTLFYIGSLSKAITGVGIELLAAPRTREMISPVTPGMTGTPGWFAREVSGLTIVAKDGAASGYSSQFQFAKGRGDAVIFIMNPQGKELGTHALANDLLREVCALPIPQRRPGASQRD